ncbi:hypothetical protein TPHA_0P00190 [Tetrapisispora phaffii CBS 4417]|uniref:Iron transport multicopper oxidase FET5 n=1 Tax=Tetrapisispora phaffii (strain ATCC 24235 / CBS 4417 / NBRC 1672 / NRRL Y-8282 / UCD 70-5) TaxID=1071381 RepID=G8C1Z9_TETPH|nr:hypothetical protein TPHA_0P00190 [Tetrapisispora phaffii CBS 4417]CCE66177.1 hypothetical protein TPHA_0P00190 [Tetrapisispora phaffii CBS 4417]
MNLLWLILAVKLEFSLAKTHQFNFTAGWVNANPDGVTERQMIGFNGVWPIPDIHVNKGDRVELYLTNKLGEGIGTSLHFHGLFMNSSYGNANQADGPEMVTQCPIMNGDMYLYNFTVPNQAGTYWYHAHSGSQYGDGMRAAFIIHDEDEPFEYDDEMVISLADLYVDHSYDLTRKFLSRFNPTGAEPIPSNILFNNTMNATLNFEPEKTYLLRFINMGLFVSQFIAIEDHEMTIVEIDGVFIKPNSTDLLSIASGQRISVLVKAKKEDPGRNFAIMQMMDVNMLDVVPEDLVLNRTNYISYNEDYSKPKAFTVPDFKSATNDFYLRPIDEIELLDKYDVQIQFDVRMDNLGDGVNYAFFNNISYTSPKIPTLTTLLTSGELGSNPLIYGDNINAHVLKGGEIIEVVLNNYDPGRHPFHLHGHNFQIVQKSGAYREDKDYPPEEQDSITIPYNESFPLMPMPDYPMIRDTVVLEPNGHVVIRFRADNPGVWLFHCHVNWHVEQGLAAVFIEDPLVLQEREQLSDNYRQICSHGGFINEGNAAGHSDDWFNMDDLPRQKNSLPDGFQLKGYIAFFISTVIGLFGLYTITQYGLQDSIPNDQEVYSRLKSILEENNLNE